jgi:light-regulated signal transduction histidine kinase (bacteriophytochrome)
MNRDFDASGLPVTHSAASQVDEEVRKLSAELERKDAEITALNQELEALSYSVSHDLRAPLRHISGFASLMQKNAATLDEKNRRYLNAVEEAEQQMGQLLDALLAFSRVGRAEMHCTRICLHDLARAARDEILVQAKGRDIVWEIGALPEVEGDPALLRVALVNLISNAVKYTAPRAQARIQIGYNGEEAGEVVCFVRDNGVGFDMRYADRLFGVFQRLHRIEDFPGTAIGLAKVRRIVHRHGGRTWATGAIDEGATFYFSLPRAHDLSTAATTTGVM